MFDDPQETASIFAIVVVVTASIFHLFWSGKWGFRKKITVQILEYLAISIITLAPVWILQYFHILRFVKRDDFFLIYSLFLIGLGSYVPLYYANNLKHVMSEEDSESQNRSEWIANTYAFVLIVAGSAAAFFSILDSNTVEAAHKSSEVNSNCLFDIEQILLTERDAKLSNVNRSEILSKLTAQAIVDCPTTHAREPAELE